jgi:multidrug efflux pump subunit AcrA (membrane-fusion protein)
MREAERRALQQADAEAQQVYRAQKTLIDTQNLARDLDNTEALAAHQEKLNATQTQLDQLQGDYKALQKARGAFEAARKEAVARTTMLAQAEKAANVGRMGDFLEQLPGIPTQAEVDAAYDTVRGMNV